MDLSFVRTLWIDLIITLRCSQSRLQSNNGVEYCGKCQKTSWLLLCVWVLSTCIFHLCRCWLVSVHCIHISHEHCWLYLIYFHERYGHKARDEIVNVEKMHIKMFSISLIRHYVDDKHRRSVQRQRHWLDATLTHCHRCSKDPQKMVRDFVLCALHVSNARNKNGNRLHLNISYFFKAKRTEWERERWREKNRRLILDAFIGS